MSNDNGNKSVPCPIGVNNPEICSASTCDACRAQHSERNCSRCVELEAEVREADEMIDTWNRAGDVFRWLLKRGEVPEEGSRRIRAMLDAGTRRKLKTTRCTGGNSHGHRSIYWGLGRFGRQARLDRASVRRRAGGIHAALPDVASQRGWPHCLSVLCLRALHLAHDKPVQPGCWPAA